MLGLELSYKHRTLSYFVLKWVILLKRWLSTKVNSSYVLGPMFHPRINNKKSKVYFITLLRRHKLLEVLVVVWYVCILFKFTSTGMKWKIHLIAMRVLTSSNVSQISSLQYRLPNDFVIPSFLLNFLNWYCSIRKCFLYVYYRENASWQCSGGHIWYQDWTWAYCTLSSRTNSVIYVSISYKNPILFSGFMPLLLLLILSLKMSPRVWEPFI